MQEYFNDIYQAGKTILIGMGITFRHLFVKSVTMQYPHIQPQIPEGSRQRLDLFMDDCIGCMQCARACPVECIDIVTVKAGKDEDLGETSDGQKKRLHVVKFDIDMGKCCYCAECVYPCPTGCIHMVPEYETAIYDHGKLLQHFSVYSAKDAADLMEKDRLEKAAREAAREAKQNESSAPGQTDK